MGLMRRMGLMGRMWLWLLKPQSRQLDTAFYLVRLVCCFSHVRASVLAAQGRRAH